MNSDILKGNWSVLKGKIKQTWGKLTDDDISVAEGNIDELRGRLEKAYGYSADEARREIDSFKLRHNTQF